MTEVGITAAERRISLAIVMAATATVAVALSLSWPLLSLVLKARGLDDDTIGISAAVQMAAIVVVMPAFPRLVAWAGTVPLMLASGLAMAISLALLPVFDSIEVWHGLRFVLGAGAELLLVTADTWVNQVADARTRGRVIGLYGFSIAAGFMLGPLIIAAVGSEGWAPFAVGVALVVAGTAPLAFAGRRAPAIVGRAAHGLARYVLLAPTLLIAGLLYGLLESAAMTFLPLYALAYGYGADAAALTLVATGLGALAGQIPIGWLAEHVNARALMAAAGAITFACALALPLVIAQPALTWVVLGLWGLAGGSMYTLAMIMMGQRFRGPDLAAINAAYVIVWGFGSIVGPGAAGAAMTAFGADGLAVMLAVGATPLVVVALWRWRA